MRSSLVGKLYTNYIIAIYLALTGAPQTFFQRPGMSFGWYLLKYLFPKCFILQITFHPLLFLSIDLVATNEEYALGAGVCK